MKKNPTEAVSNLRVILFIIFALAMFIVCQLTCGCVLTKGAWYPKTETEQARFEFRRFALLYPFKVGIFEFDPNTGLFTLNDYDTDGGEAMIKTAFEAGAEFGATMAKKAVMP